MSGRRLLDAARIFGAARGVVKNHYGIRSRQWDVLTKTSTLAKAVKNQTDRITVTAGAAYALAKRFSENEASYNVRTDSREQSAQSPIQDDPIPRRDTGQDVDQAGAEVGLEQDHHYKRSEDNAAVDPAPQGEMQVGQEKAARYPTADGSIPPKGAHLEGTPSRQGQDTFTGRPRSETGKDPLGENVRANQEVAPKEARTSTIPSPADAARKMQRLSESQIPSQSASSESVSSQSRADTNGQDTFNTRSQEFSPAFSSLPRVKIPRQAGDSQGGDSHVEDGSINADVFYSTNGPTTEQSMSIKEAIPEQNDVPEGINTDVFHSPQVASLFRSGGQDDRRKAYEMRMRAAGRSPRQQSSPTSGINSDTFTSRADSVTEKPDIADGQASVGTIAPTQHNDEDTRKFAESLAEDALKAEQTPTELPTEAVDQPASSPYQMRESRVPSSRFGRIWQFGGLATSMAFGAVGESFRRITGGSSDGSLMLSEANMNRLVAKLSRMRGAALKLGQMMSFQDSKLLPPAINAVLQRVQDSADYMPTSQRNQVMASSLGADWKDLFSSFEDVPLAAASIGQVHRATLASTGQEVAVKVQYPGVSSSINSDLNNISLLLTASRLLPKGLYLDKTIANARTELAWECDYTREAECGIKFRELLSDETDVFIVPRVFTEASGAEVLTAEFMSGKAVTKIPDLTQEERDWIGTQILRLAFRELMEWQFMQTDPNWTNFLYNRQHPTGRKIELLDFGASRAFPEEFTTPYINLLIAASKRDREACRELSVQLGYLTGQESTAMLDAHVDSILTLAEPFLDSNENLVNGLYDFRDQTITDRVRAKIGIMVRERLAPPPEETYSLHRKLSGAFLLCARLGSRVPTRDMFQSAVERWQGRRSGKAA